MIRESRNRDQRNRLSAISILNNRLQNECSHTHEQIIRIRNISPHAKQLHQIVKLSMYVTAYLFNHLNQRLPSEYGLNRTYRYRRIDPHYIALFYQQLACFVT